ncbi:tRNA threonylcarbamoyl adenosine modification protein, Sua5/YciO/YrdC/YwlC family [Geodermatophilus obscurus]|uniref:L-threonylcarbamoyladenylate synthase n=1 Tax=Geodermatophilus obscurus TaxID=1861 RepID=A0A1M7S2Y8_9ACTN|nr:Sua5/YciO/YrdC/YwlC family protein [Geodermatophilus obscurus]SHN52735.1 tRNA threonylcarbamoyl adenosine modification protein, Sua5/YciO/YrdC/YwlC family [Geodermatophilus obscurus]
MEVIAAEDLPRAAAALQAGGVVVVPTARWYMMCADASNAGACSRLFVSKARAATKPLAYVLPRARLAEDEFVLSASARRLAAAFWPGNLALVLPWRDTSRGQRLSSVGTPHALVTSDPGVLGELAAVAAVPLAATTVNVSTVDGSSPGPAITTGEVQRFTERTGLTIDFCVEGGITPVNNHLTIVDCTTDRPVLVRTGVVHERAVAAALAAIPQ